MSTWIYGAVEIQKFDDGFDDWFEIIDVGMALGGDYDLFGCLFGVRNYANFKPLFPGRGAPPDCSAELLARYNDAKYYNNLTWCTYRELLDIDLDVSSEEPDSRIVVDIETPTGTDRMKIPPRSVGEGKLRRYISRREALDNSAFKMLMELMGVLAKQYRPEGVRMVVWFD